LKRGTIAAYMFAGSICAALIIHLWPERTAVQVETVQIQSGPLVRTVLLDGVVSCEQEQACFSPKQGTVAAVYVKEGQQVACGDLLFQLDTSAEEAALARLYRMRYDYQSVLNQLDLSAEATVLQAQLEWNTTERQLVAGISASQIRAHMDGTVETIAVEKGALVSGAQVLGVIHGNDKVIKAQAYTEDVRETSSGAAAVVKTAEGVYPLVLKDKKNLPENPDFQIVYFEPAEQAGIDHFHAGRKLTVELVRDTEDCEALIPLEAIDSDGNVWYIQSGKAYSGQVEAKSFNRTHAAGEKEWSGRKVILYPDRFQLENGMRVQVSP